MLVSMKEICKIAKENHFGVPALGVNNEHNIRCAVEAAEEAKSPLIILVTYGAHPDWLYFCETCNRIADQASVPVATILDHGRDFNKCVWAIRGGLTDIMIDKSAEPYEVNAAEVKRVCEVAHEIGIGVEAELGHVGSASNYEHDGHTAFTEPEAAVKFVEETGVDYLAVAVGTAHGAYPKGMKPEIQFDLLKELAEKVSVPLVLHGGSGSGDENIAKACQLGICKVNVANDLYKGEIAALRKANDAGVTEYAMYNNLSDGYKEVAKHYFNLCGCAGKADLYSYIKRPGLPMSGGMLLK